MFNWGYAKFSIRAHDNESTEITVTMERVKNFFVKRQLNNFIKYLEIDKPTKDAMGITGEITVHESENKEIYLSLPNQHSKENNLPFLLQTYFIRNHERISAVTTNEPPVPLITRRKSIRIPTLKEKKINTNTEISVQIKKPKRKRKTSVAQPPNNLKHLSKKSKQSENEPAKFSFSNLETFWKDRQISAPQASFHAVPDIPQLPTALPPDLSL